MKSRTSKSASETLKTSSASGSLAKTEGMASQTQRLKRTAKFKKMVAYIKGMTDKEFKEMTLKVGIVTKSGTLAQKYRTVKKTKKKPVKV